jgi:hypothetical protein
MAGFLDSAEPTMTDQASPPQPPTCTRAVAGEGTSYMAFRHEPLAPDDPLLGFRPVMHNAPRRNTITPARQRAFIAALAERGIVVQAARQIGASTDALYKLRNKPGAEEFRAAWDAAIDRGVMRLEDCALARAMEGEQRMVVSGGQVLGHERRFNDNLVMFFLRHRRGERYAPDWRSIRAGHPLYERIKAEVLEEYRAREEEDEQATLDAIDAFLEGMRQKRLAHEALEAELAAEEAESERARAAEHAERKRPEEDAGEEEQD